MSLKHTNPVPAPFSYQARQSPLVIRLKRLLSLQLACLRHAKGLSLGQFYGLEQAIRFTLKRLAYLKRGLAASLLAAMLLRPGAAHGEGNSAGWANKSIHRGAFYPSKTFFGGGELTIAGDFRGAMSVQAVDLDKDGDLDVVGAAYQADDIAWWENTAGNGSAWTKHTVDGNVDGAFTAYAADVDGDGDLDILGTAFAADTVAWWENTTGNGSAWTKHTIDGSFNGAYTVYAADVDGDGDLDVLGTGHLADDIAWWENTAGNGSAWTKRVIYGTFDGAISVDAADLDGDGDLDILGTAVFADDVIWWENTAGNGSAWTGHLVDGNFDGAISVDHADVDGDGDLDILGAAYYDATITWWENTAGNGSAWMKHGIGTGFDRALSVQAVDLDKDGDLDVVGAAYLADDIAWWENTAGNGSAWTQHLVDGNFDGAARARAADLDGDSDLDILGAAYLAHDIVWWKNQEGQPLSLKLYLPFVTGGDQ